MKLLLIDCKTLMVHKYESKKRVRSDQLHIAPENTREEILEVLENHRKS